MYIKEEKIMDKFEYESRINHIKLLENKKERLRLENIYLKSIKPSIFDKEKRSIWLDKKNNISKTISNISEELLLAYQELEKLFPKVKNNC